MASKLEKALRRIVLSVLAAPISASAACRAHDPEPAANTPDASGEDARAADASRAEDAALLPTYPDADARACAPYSIDGAALDQPISDGGLDADAAGCADFRMLPCGIPQGAKVEDCFIDLYTCARACGTNYLYYCQLASVSCNEAGVIADASVIVDCVSCAGASGRRPRGLSDPQPAAGTRSRSRSPLGDYFASMAHLESASVRAFCELERWLVRHRAPRRLVRGAQRAANDERRHARITRRLARRFGGEPASPRVQRVPDPSLVELLMDDAIEGCVSETFGALVATWQAERACDVGIRRTMRAIAVDETRHAALAWAILRWGLDRVDGRDRLAIQRALHAAARALAERRWTPEDESVHAAAGCPSPQDAQRLAHAFAAFVMHDI